MTAGTTVPAERLLCGPGRRAWGLSCAYFLGRLGYQVDVSRRQRPGGHGGPCRSDFRLPTEVVERELKGLTLPGISYKYNMALGQDVTVKADERVQGRLPGPGSRAGRRLDLPGLDGAAVIDALGFLVESRNNGGLPVKDRVLVIGGGSVASDVAIMAQNQGAKKVSIVCLESADEMPCLPGEVEDMKLKGIEFYNGWGPKEAVQGSRMHFAACTRVFDDQGRFAPSFEESKSMELDFDQIILAVGQSVESGLASYLKEEFQTDGLLGVEAETLQVRAARPLCRRRHHTRSRYDRGSGGRRAPRRPGHASRDSGR